MTFEGYGPGGVGVLVQVVTNNRNRIVSEIRHMMAKNGGNMAETGAVGWMFHRKGDIVVPKEQADEDKMLGIVLDAGAEDLRDDGAAWEVTTPPEAMEKVREALDRRGHHAGFRGSCLGAAKLREAQPARRRSRCCGMVETLEDHDDVQHVYANFDIDEKEIQAAVASYASTRSIDGDTALKQHCPSPVAAVRTYTGAAQCSPQYHVARRVPSDSSGRQAARAGCGSGACSGATGYGVIEFDAAWRAPDALRRAETARRA